MTPQEKGEIVAGFPYDQLGPLPMRLLLLDLLSHVPGSRELFEQGEAGDALKMVREAANVKLGKGARIDKETFLHLVLTALTPVPEVNTYQSEETLV
jgi:hypothetical protein